MNTRYGIYDRTGAPVSEGNLEDLTPGVSDTCGGDPQTIWDGQTSRFYVTNTDFCDAKLSVTYSKTASPSSPADWCTTVMEFGFASNALVDYEKLGDTADFLLIGLNLYAGQVDGDVAWVAKPPAATGCVNLNASQKGVLGPLVEEDGTPTFTPVPANQIDPSSRGSVVSAAYPYSGHSPRHLTVWPVRKAADGSATLGSPKTVNVPFYDVPSNARQLGTQKKLDAFDTRLWQVVSAFDPRKNRVAIWTQHTVFGGGGAEIRWYEVGNDGKLLQSGAVTDPDGWVFNGAISPDRVLNGTTTGYGQNMVLGFNHSSTTEYPSIQMVTKRGSAAQTDPVLVKQSPGFDADYSCGKSCRWGDYASATPDPLAPLGVGSGVVWLANQWNVASTSTDADWRTWIWAAKA